MLPFCGGLVFFLAFVLSLFPVAYSILRGWFILFTGDVSFLPSLSVLFSGLWGW